MAFILAAALLGPGCKEDDQGRAGTFTAMTEPR